MRLLGRGWQQSLIGAYEKPPAMPEDIYYAHISFVLEATGVPTCNSNDFGYKIALFTRINSVFYAQKYYS